MNGRVAVSAHALHVLWVSSLCDPSGIPEVLGKRYYQIIRKLQGCVILEEQFVKVVQPLELKQKEAVGY